MRHLLKSRFQSETFKVFLKEYYWIEDQMDRISERSLM
jgi:hypothetical protein